jgi:hypothetical protein
MKKDTHFRRWLAEIWRENCEEHRVYNQLPYTLEEYWNRYKYWLKREYRHQQRHGKK